ncbi:dTDP-4-dehydrorhamnose 3,5-epimerase family protein [Pseudonocardia sp. KRD291]|uniref:dTDP-4-dehydrorhamnose 3,5-epimerase family protein n=1 Tax=Pseudonocardia sp. KRD291 TaxID=2792007 RepID=UPI001C4A349E|nr:dTDP-4-dehydrorhamnose 3,5-epimerase [Pseudonocardia sp. KRD291]MBW0101565.1 dTDP-4-dehydrorhamnose 3,5-epimerase family protein [Pseudonocardia sp. KRD291]
MDVLETDLTGVLMFRPAPHRDDRGFFSRTYDDTVAERWGIVRADFVQDSQSRSRHGVLRGLHGRSSGGEAKIVRCAHGSAFVAIVDARPESPTLGRHVSLTLDDEDMVSVYVPRRMLVGFQVTGEVADMCYSIDRPHVAEEGLAVRHDDPDLGITWPMPPSELSDRDRNAPSWAEFLHSLDIGPARR